MVRNFKNNLEFLAKQGVMLSFDESVLRTYEMKKRDYLHQIPDPTGSIHDALQIENAARNLVVSNLVRLWRALTTNRSNRLFTSRPLGENSMREQIGKCYSGTSRRESYRS